MSAMNTLRFRSRSTLGASQPADARHNRRAETEQESETIGSSEGILAGYLKKQGAKGFNVIKGWRKRWFYVPKGSRFLQYYKHRDDADPKGQIDLGTITAITTSSTTFMTQFRSSASSPSVSPSSPTKQPTTVPYNSSSSVMSIHNITNATPPSPTQIPHNIANSSSASHSRFSQGHNNSNSSSSQYNNSSSSSSSGNVGGNSPLGTPHNAHGGMTPPVQEKPTRQSRQSLRDSYVFHLETPGRTYTMQASDDKELRYWIEGLTCLVSSIQDGGVAPVDVLSFPEEMRPQIESENTQSGQLFVRILEAEELCFDRLDGQRNIYCILSLDKQQDMTQPVLSTNSPVQWNEAFFFDITKADFEANSKLIISVWMQDFGRTSGVLLGSLDVPVSSVIHGKPIDQHFLLQQFSSDPSVASPSPSPSSPSFPSVSFPSLTQSSSSAQICLNNNNNSNNSMTDNTPVSVGDHLMGLPHLSSQMDIEIEVEGGGSQVINVKENDVDSNMSDDDDDEDHMKRYGGDDGDDVDLNDEDRHHDHTNSMHHNNRVHSMPPVQTYSASSNSMDICKLLAPTSGENTTVNTSSNFRPPPLVRRSSRVAYGKLHLRLLFTRVQQDKVKLQDFDILSLIGRGGYGKVYKVRKRDTGRIYAMKVLKKQSVIAANAVRHTMTEQDVMKRINHPFVVSLRYSFQTDDKLYLVMDYLGGGELFYHMSNVDQFDEEQARFYAAQVLLAIEYLHQNGIIYRDLKPENFVLDILGHVHLTDFGLVKQGMAHNDVTFTFCGSPEYLAPEVLLPGGYGKEIDWWALGTLLYEMLEGLPPYYDENRNEMNRKILYEPLVFSDKFSADAKHLLRSLLQRDPRMRLGSGPHDASDIKAHPFFRSVDWTKLYNKEIMPIYKPHLSDLELLSSQWINQQEESPTFSPDSPTTAPLSMSKQNLFQGFSYVSSSDEQLKNLFPSLVPQSSSSSSSSSPPSSASESSSSSPGAEIFIQPIGPPPSVFAPGYSSPVAMTSDPSTITKDGPKKSPISLSPLSSNVLTHFGDKFLSTNSPGSSGLLKGKEKTFSIGNHKTVQKPPTQVVIPQIQVHTPMLQQQYPVHLPPLQQQPLLQMQSQHLPMAFGDLPPLQQFPHHPLQQQHHQQQQQQISFGELQQQQQQMQMQQQMYQQRHSQQMAFGDSQFEFSDDFAFHPSMKMELDQSDKPSQSSSQGGFEDDDQEMSF